jgi:hypothetical protein
MTAKHINAFITMTVLSLIISACAPTQVVVTPPTASSKIETATPAAPTLTPALTPTPNVTSLPSLTLKPGDSYFSLDGKQSFVLSRNPTGKTLEDFDTVLDWARQGGTRVLRVHLTHGWWGDPWINKDWSVDEAWARDWDGFFDRAQADGIYVIPVFGVWADWNNGAPDWGSPFWKYNPMNPASGGAVSSPAELFKSGSDTQNHWMEWMKTLVTRWQGRKNIAAWEIFSEINIASGPTGQTDAKGGVNEAAGVDFTNKAMSIIHAADPQHRPVTLSLAGVYSPTDPWAEYYKLDSLDFIEIHPYSDTLDRELLKEVPAYQTKYQKPVMIAESGLWSMTHNANAHIGIEHAIWAGMVSGAMNGRGLWDNDGYSIYSIANRADALQFMQSYATTELPVVKFTDGVDFTGFKPIPSISASGVWGAAVGNEKMVLGWFRDANSEPPDWKLQASVSKQTVTLTVPGSAANWLVDFYNTRTGTDIVGSTTVTRQGGKITLTLPDFTDDIAFKMSAQK